MKERKTTTPAMIREPNGKEPTAARPAATLVPRILESFVSPSFGAFFSSSFLEILLIVGSTIVVSTLCE